MKQYLEAGKIVNTHGTGGYVKIESWCDSPEILASLGTLYLVGADGEYLPLHIAASSVHKHMALIKIENIDTVEKALRLKNTVVFANRDDLPIGENSHFIADLIGLPVIDADNSEMYGKLTDVTNNGASEIYEITKENGQKGYMPAVREFIVEIDLIRGIFIRPIEGMLD